MCKYTNFNNLKKKERDCKWGWGCGGQVKLTFVEIQKLAKKIQKEEIENSKNNLFYE